MAVKPRQRCCACDGFVTAMATDKPEGQEMTKQHLHVLWEGDELQLIGTVEEADEGEVKGQLGVEGRLGVEGEGGRGVVDGEEMKGQARGLRVVRMRERGLMGKGGVDQGT